MSQNVGEVDLSLVLQSKQFKDQLNSAVNSAVKDVKKNVSGLSGTFSKLGAVIGGAFAVKQIVAFGKQCTKLGSDLAEVQNVVDVTFSTMSDDVNEFAENAIETFGLSETVAKKYVGTFGAMAKSFRFSEQAAYDMSTTLTGLAGDVASFYNLSSDEAYTKLKSVFTGETESLKELGVVMTQTALDEFAMAQGLGKTTSAMSEQEKTALRYEFVLDRLSTASGDFARTSDSWANQTRVLSLRFDALKASIGQGLINVLTPVVKFLNIILAKLNTVAKAFANFTAMLMGKKTTQQTGQIASDLTGATDAADGLASGVDAVGDSATKAAKAAKSLMGIDELNKLSDTAESDTGGTGAATGGNVDFGTDDLQTAADAAEETAKSFIQEMVDAFKNGFSTAFSTADFEGLKANIANLKENIKSIFTDPAVLTSAQTFALAVSTALGQITGSVASIGVSIANGLLGGVNSYLTEHGEFIKQSLINIFDVGSDLATLFGNFGVAIATIFSSIGTSAGQTFLGSIIACFGNGFLGYIQTFGQTLSTILTPILQPIIDNAEKIKEAFVNLFTLLTPLFQGIASGISAFYTDLNALYQEVIKPIIDTLTEAISGVLGELLDWFNGLCEELGVTAPALQSIGEVIGYVIGAITAVLAVIAAFKAALLIWNGVCAIATLVTTGFGAAIAFLTSPVTIVIAIIAALVAAGVALYNNWDSVKEFCGTVWEGIKNIISGVVEAIKGFISTAWNTIKTVTTTVFTAIKTFFSTVWNGIKSVVSTVINGIKTFISTTWNAIKTTISNVLNTIKTVFSNVWNAIKTTVSNVIGGIANGIKTAFTTVKNVLSNILNGIKSIFSNVFNALVNIVKKPINAIIGAINKLIDGLNSVSIDVPSWVPLLGGKKFGFNVPHIPELANGGYVAANTPQLAMIGDNKNEGEIVAPESKIAEAVAAGMQSVMSQLAALVQGGGQLATADGQPINIYLGEELIDTMIISSQNRHNLRSGGR